MRSLLRHPDYYKNKFTFFFHQVEEWVERVWVLETKNSKEANFTKTKKHLRYMI